jgi:hypothetical protein
MDRTSGTAWLSREQGRRTSTVLVACIVAGIVAGILAGVLAEANRAMALFGFLVVLVPFVAWRRLGLAVAGVALLAIVIEQYPIGSPISDLTDHIPLFTSLSDAFHLSGLYVNPMEILLAIVLLVLLLRAGRRQARLPRTALALGLAALLGLVLAGAVHGVLAGGDYKMALWEIRPTIYVAATYFFATQLPDRVGTVTAFLWTFVAAMAIKTVQGMALVVIVLLVHGQRPDALLSHEDSVFFVLFIILVAGLWLFRLAGPLRKVATALLPFILIVDLANNRRTAWLQLAACLLALLVLAWVRLPDRRRFAAGALVLGALVSAVYLPLYWNHGGLIAEPARAIRSMIAPDPRDASSDLYRVAENANLTFNIKRSPLIGAGYGIPINYVIPIVDLTSIDPFIKFIPHNDVLYVWMRIGAIGALAFWSFIGLAVVRACRVLRSRDPTLALYGALVVCAVVDYLIQGQLDLGFFWFRVAIFMGCMLGVLEVAARVHKREGRQERKATGPPSLRQLRNLRIDAGNGDVRPALAGVRER